MSAAVMDTASIPFRDQVNKPRVRSGQSIDKKSGKIYIVYHKGDKKHRVQVYMKVIGNIYEHHAQIYTDSDYCLQIGCLSLRNCVVTKVPDHRNCINVVIESLPDVRHQGVVFEAVKDIDTEEWIRALTPTVSLLNVPERSLSHSPMMVRSTLHALSRFRNTIQHGDFSDDF